jgi:hypothetical protein
MVSAANAAGVLHQPETPRRLLRRGMMRGWDSRVIASLESHPAIGSTSPVVARSTSPAPSPGARPLDASIKRRLLTDCAVCVY